MKHALILSLCFLPLAVIYIVMKVSLWLSTSVSEVNYVREDAKREHGPYLEDPYGDLDEKEENS
jgi:hypothetical protein